MGSLSSFITLADEDAVRIMRDYMKGISNFLKIISWKLKATPIAGIMIILLARQQIGPTISVVLTMQNHNLCLIGRKSLFSFLLDSSFINSRHLPFSRN